MSTYDFDTLHSRRDSYSMKWDIQENELPLWVADMDFQTAPAVIEALKKRVEQGIFGYTIIPDAWEEAVINWWDRRHNFKMEKDWLIFTTGVVPAISSAVERLTNIGDNVLVQTPVYDIFFNSIENHGRHPLENRLAYDGQGYHIDFEDLEEKLRHPYTRLMILCNPHNPVGRLWSPEDLAKIGDLCHKHHVTVLSDEIHCDLTEPGLNYTPFASVNETCRSISMTCLSASKAFNVAGLQSAIVSVPDPGLRAVVSRGLNSSEVAEPNAFAMDGVIAAFNEGEEWLEALKIYIAENKQLVKDFLAKELGEIRLIQSQATYLLWMDCSALTDDSTSLQQFIRQETGLFLSDGAHYRGNGGQFLRMNIACPKARLEDGLARLKAGVEAFKKQV